MIQMNRTHLFFDCKHKHMMKSGAPPNKVAVLHCLLTIGSYIFQVLIVILLWLLVLAHFRDGTCMCPVYAHSIRIYRV